MSSNFLTKEMIPPSTGQTLYLHLSSSQMFLVKQTKGTAWECHFLFSCPTVVFIVSLHCALFTFQSALHRFLSQFATKKQNRHSSWDKNPEQKMSQCFDAHWGKYDPKKCFDLLRGEMKPGLITWTTGSEGHGGTQANTDYICSIQAVLNICWYLANCKLKKVICLRSGSGKMLNLAQIKAETEAILYFWLDLSFQGCLTDFYCCCCWPSSSSSSSSSSSTFHFSACL